MKPSNVFFSLLLVIFLLSGCTAGGNTQKPEPPPVPSIITEPVVSETELTIPPTDPSVDTLICVRKEVYEWTDSAGNTNRVSLRIPSLNVDNDDAIQLNQIIADYCNQIEAEVSSAKKGAYSTFTNMLDFEAYLNDNVLSLLVIHQSTFDYTEYTVFNYDISASKILTVADMCRLYLDLDYAIFLKYTNDTILQEFRTTFQSLAESDPEGFQTMENMFSKNVISLFYRRLYVNENGILMLATDKPAIAGGGMYSVTEEMNVFTSALPEETSAYAWLFDLYKDSKDAYSTELNQILSIAYSSNPDSFSAVLAQRPDAEAAAIHAALGNG